MSDSGGSFKCGHIQHCDTVDGSLLGELCRYFPNSKLTLGQHGMADHNGKQSHAQEADCDNLWDSTPARRPLRGNDSESRFALTSGSGCPTRSGCATSSCGRRSHRSTSKQRSRPLVARGFRRTSSAPAWIARRLTSSPFDVAPQTQGKWAGHVQSPSAHRRNVCFTNASSPE